MRRAVSTLRAMGEKASPRVQRTIRVKQGRSALETIQPVQGADKGARKKTVIYVGEEGNRHVEDILLVREGLGPSASRSSNGGRGGKRRQEARL